MTLEIPGCVHYSKYNCPWIFYSHTNDAIDHLLVNFTFILLLLAAVEYSREIHEGEWLVALLADFDREDVAPKPANRYRNSITVKGMGARANSHDFRGSLDQLFEAIKAIQFSSSGRPETWTRMPSPPACFGGRRPIPEHHVRIWSLLQSWGQKRRILKKTHQMMVVTRETLLLRCRLLGARL
jgi:hypothetical protein